MNENIKEALIGDEGKDTSRNIKAIITLDGSLPFISLSQASGPGAVTADDSSVGGITYNCGISKMAIVKRPAKNLLVDADNPDRYIFIAVMASYAQSVEMDVYYDTDEKDLFCIPSLVDVGDTDLTKDLLSNKTIRVTGYGLGVNGGYEINSSCSAVYNKCKLDAEPKPIDTQLNFLRVPGKTGNAMGSQGLLLGGGDIYIEGTKSIPSEFISLGSTATLGTKVPVWRYVRVGINKMELHYGGIADLDDVLIPMPL